MRMIQTGGVKLDELHVGHPAAGAPGHGDAVAGGAVRIAGIEVNPAGAAGCQYHESGGAYFDLAGMPVQHISAQAAVATQTQLAAGNQIDGAALFVEGDVGVLTGALFQRGLDGAAGGVGGMHDPSMAVAALAMQVILRAAFGVGFPGEGSALRAQPFDRRSGMFHGEADCVGVA